MDRKWKLFSILFRYKMVILSIKNCCMLWMSQCCSFFSSLDLYFLMPALGLNTTAASTCLCVGDYATWSLACRTHFFRIRVGSFCPDCKDTSIFIRALGGFVTIHTAFFEDSKSSINCEFMSSHLKNPGAECVSNEVP